MTDDADLVDALLLQQGLGVVRQLGEAELVALGLARTAETDLIRGDYAVTCLAEHLDGALPGRATEILAMQQERRAAVRLAGRRNVHVGHLHRLALGLETIVLERMRIAEAFQLRAIAGPAFGQYWQTQGKAGGKRQSGHGSFHGATPLFGETAPYIGMHSCCRVRDRIATAHVPAASAANCFRGGSAPPAG